MTVVKQARDLHTSTIDQRAAAAYLASGRLPAHLQRVRAEYRERLDALLRALPQQTPPGSSWTEPDGGMFVWLTLPEGADTSLLFPRAVTRGVAFVPGAPFYADAPVHRSARLSFVTLGVAEIAEGMARLGRAIRSRD